MLCLYCEKEILNPAVIYGEDICFNCEMFIIKHEMIFHSKYDKNYICDHSDEWFKCAIKKKYKCRTKQKN